MYLSRYRHGRTQPEIVVLKYTCNNYKIKSNYCKSLKNVGEVIRNDLINASVRNIDVVVVVSHIIF